MMVVRNCGFPNLETNFAKPEKVTLPVERFVNWKKNAIVGFAPGCGGIFVCGVWAGTKMFLYEKVAC